VIACVASVIAFKIPLSLWEKSGPYLLMASFVILVLILIPGFGRTANGATRWLALGPFTLQGSEVAKLGVIVYLGNYLVRQHELVRSHWLGFLNPLIIMSFFVWLLILEPDFGAVVVLSTAALGMLFLGGVRVWQFGLSAIALAIFAFFVVSSSDYRMQRLYVYLDPWADQFGDGYQLTQSLIAFGRGDWFGLGLGNSIQKLFYLPEAHTDFIFAIMAEELGFIGCLIALFIYVVFIGRVLVIARKAESMGRAFGAYVAYGVALVFSAQLIINVSVNIGLLPTKGLTLPFLSYGGSSLLISCVFVALIMRIHRELMFEAADASVKKYGVRGTRDLLTDLQSTAKPSRRSVGAMHA
jgi:cell division protein FtsW